MKIADFLTPERTCCDAPGISKKRVLEFLSGFLAEHSENIDADRVYQELLAREKLGSTGIGDGVAVPHCRLEGCPDVIGALLKLEHPVDYDAIDDQPVDLVFALVVPSEQNEEHLRVLQSIAGLMQQPSVRRQLRGCSGDSALYRAATEVDNP